MPRLIQVRRPGLEFPKWPFGINREGWQARGLIHLSPLVGVSAGASTRDFSGFDRPTTVNGTPPVSQGPLGAAVEYDVNGDNHSWSASGSSFLRLQEFTQTGWFAAISLAETNRVLFQVDSRLQTGFRLNIGGLLASNELGGSWYDGAFKAVSSNKIFSSADFGIWYHYAFTCEQGGVKRFYLDGLETDNQTSAGDILYNAARGASIGGTEWSGGLERSRCDIKDQRMYDRVLSSAEVWQLYDPRTRWDLYKPLSRPNFYYTPAAAGGANNPWNYYAQM